VSSLSKRSLKEFTKNLISGSQKVKPSQEHTPSSSTLQEHLGLSGLVGGLVVNAFINANLNALKSLIIFVYKYF
jgi:hypothetical protein